MTRWKQSLSQETESKVLFRVIPKSTFLKF